LRYAPKGKKKRKTCLGEKRRICDKRERREGGGGDPVCRGTGEKSINERGYPMSLKRESESKGKGSVCEKRALGGGLKTPIRKSSSLLGLDTKSGNRAGGRLFVIQKNKWQSGETRKRHERGGKKDPSLPDGPQNNEVDVPNSWRQRGKPVLPGE